MAPLTIHGYPGVPTYPDASFWKNRSHQAHWGQQDTAFLSALIVPGLVVNHTHNDLKFPDWAEVDDTMSLDIPVTLKMFHTDGYLEFAVATLVGNNGRQDFHVDLDKWPFTGDPGGLVQANGGFHIDFKDALAIDVPRRGWFGVRLATRTILKNGVIMDCEAWRPLYSMIDPSAIERPPTEDSIQLATKTIVQSNQENLPFNLQVLEFHRMIPSLRPLLAPQVLEPFAYGYQQAFPDERYVLTINASLHDGIEGVVQRTVAGGTGRDNFDLFKPAEFLTYPKPAALNLAPNQFTALFGWLVNSKNGFTMKPGAPDQSEVRAGRQLGALLTETFTVGAGADDNATPVRWTIDDSPIIIVTPPVDPPVVPVPIAVPMFEGQVEPAGSDALLALGLMPMPSTVASDLQKGTILPDSEIPAPGHVVVKGTMVGYQVSAGPVVVPPVESEETCAAFLKGAHRLQPDGTIVMDVTSGGLLCDDGSGLLERLTVIGGTLVCRKEPA